VGNKLTLEAGDCLEIVVGRASLIMKRDGTITLSGKDIQVSASGSVNIRSAGKVVIKGSKVQTR
jgi:type VI secretion system secreted protein VgrG